VIEGKRRRKVSAVKQDAKSEFKHQFGYFDQNVLC
jgi:hypothetical protein